MTAPAPHSSPLPISDELLSAYLDRQVTAAESARVEQAQAQDDEVALRLHLLEQTVQLLRQTPTLALPRSFVLSEAQVRAAGGQVRSARPATRSGGLLAWLGAFSPRVMPLATAAVALALLLVVGLDVGATRSTNATPAPAPTLAPAAMAEAPAEAAISAQSAESEVPPSAAKQAEGTAEVMAMTATSPEATPASDALMAEADTARMQVEGGEETAALKSVITEDELTQPTQPPLRLLEAVLAALLVALIVLTWLVRRRRTA